jgi:hypothetical protein
MGVAKPLSIENIGNFTIQLLLRMQLPMRTVINHLNGA